MGRLFVISLIVLVATVNLYAAADEEGVKFNVEAKSSKTLILVDHSGSMIDKLPDVKAAAGRLLARYPSQHQFGLITFSGCGPQYVKYAVPFGKNNGDKIKNIILSLQSGGATDLGLALKTARSIMNQSKECMRMILFSDQMDTCDNDVEKIASQIPDYCVEINVITSSVSEQTVSYYESLTKSSGGRVYSGIQSKSDIADAIDDFRARGKRTGRFSVSSQPASVGSKKGAGVGSQTKEQPQRQPAKASSGGEERSEKSKGSHQ
ncbi:MAG: VWA domain-containing protein [Deltaproteobacteria bacterium]|nr:VWA domain-containing protein [Deltaproteobacteria bacterium]